MAKQNLNDSPLSFAAAVTAMSLGTGKRLIRNFKYYKQTEPEIVSRESCNNINREIRFNIFSLQNLYLDSNDEATHGSFKVMIAKQIQDDLEQLHRTLLFFDADDIVNIIPILDQQRDFWSGSHNPDFYADILPQRINREILPLIEQTESLLYALPETSPA